MAVHLSQNGEVRCDPVPVKNIPNPGETWGVPANRFLVNKHVNSNTLSSVFVSQSSSTPAGDRFGESCEGISNRRSL